MPALVLLVSLLGRAAAEPAAPGFDRDHALWTKVLATHVIRGRVDYRRLKERPEPLELYLKTLDEVSEAEATQWSREDRLAFWINAYNAFVLKAVVDHYPIKPSFLASLRHPDDSVRQIPGFFNRLRFRVMAQRVTLDEIEHDVLRGALKEPRVHMALVCAAKSCPPLRPEAYVGSRLDGQLGEQARLFMRDPARFRLERETRRVHISSIFKWFGADFVAEYEPKSGFEGRGRKERACLNFIALHLPEPERDFLRTGSYSVRVLDYDWSLNAP